MTVGSEHVGSQVRLRDRATNRDLDGWLLAYSSHPRAVILLPDGTRLDRPAAAVSPVGDGRSTGGTAGGVTYDKALSYDLTRRAAAERALDAPEVRSAGPQPRPITIVYDVVGRDALDLLSRAEQRYRLLMSDPTAALPPHADLRVTTDTEVTTGAGETAVLHWSAHVTIEEQW